MSLLELLIEIPFNFADVLEVPLRKVIIFNISIRKIVGRYLHTILRQFNILLSFYILFLEFPLNWVRCLPFYVYIFNLDT